MTRLLYILPGLVPPTSEPARDKFQYLSEICEGEVLLPVWWHSTKQVSPHLKQNFPVYRVGRFSYHLFLFLRIPQVFRKIATFLWYISRGIQLHRENKIDVIVTYGTNTPGVAATVLKWLTGAKLIVEIPGVPENAFRYDVPNPGKQASVKRFFADRLLCIVGKASDCFKLLYPLQLQKYPELQKKKAAVFHDFVPVRYVQLAKKENQFILCIGYPWYTKGVDILIRAFKSIMKQYPDLELKLMGHYPDLHVLKELAEDCPQIEFLAPGPNELAMKVISACMIYVLASRTEGMGRVLLEAMAAGRPIIASRVGGVPHYISDNDNGLLFSSGNVEELAAKMVLLVNDKELGSRLGRRGYDRVFSEFDEVAYVREFKKMLQSIESKCPNSGSEDESKEQSVELSKL
ncbi:MAG TPA: glycosyltransferase [Candidatus Acidoferrum sp.]|jgi:glycosyltransferase involved in cell wall biosynthesis